MSLNMYSYILFYRWTLLHWSDIRGSEQGKAVGLTTVTTYRQPPTEQLQLSTVADSLQAHLQHRRMTCARSATMVLEGTGTTSLLARCWITSCLLVGLVSTVRLLDGPTSKGGHWINELKYFTYLVHFWQGIYNKYINYVSIYFHNHNIFYCIM